MIRAGLVLAAVCERRQQVVVDQVPHAHLARGRVRIRVVVDQVPHAHLVRGRGRVRVGARAAELIDTISHSTGPYSPDPRRVLLTRRQG